MVSRDSTRIHQQHPLTVSPTPKMPPHRRSRPRATVPDPGADPPAQSLDLSPASPNLSTRSLDHRRPHSPRPLATILDQFRLPRRDLPPPAISSTSPDYRRFLCRISNRVRNVALSGALATLANDTTNTVRSFNYASPKIACTNTFGRL